MPAGTKLGILDKNIAPSDRLGAAVCDWVAEKKKDARRSGTLTACIGSFQSLNDPTMWETAIHAVSQTHYGQSACLDVVPASRSVATAFARSSATCMIVVRRENTAVDSDIRLRDYSRNVHE